MHSYMSFKKLIIRKSFVSYMFAIFCFIQVVRVCYGDCTLLETSKDPDAEKREKELLKRIEPLKGLKFKTTVDDEDKFTYRLSICDKIVEKDEQDVGAVQTSDKGSTYILGRINQVDITGGTDFILLNYFNGTKYGSHCNGTQRMTSIMIVCDPDNIKGDFRVLEEKRKSKYPYCSYLFEVGSSIACKPKPSELSSGSIFCILFFTSASLYLILGFLYNRFVVGAKGIEQIPNYGFWKAFGNLQADACDFVCRCGARHESQAYRGIDERFKEAERDDQLLNM